MKERERKLFADVEIEKFIFKIKKGSQVARSLNINSLLKATAYVADKKYCAKGSLEAENEFSRSSDKNKRKKQNNNYKRQEKRDSYIKHRVMIMITTIYIYSFGCSLFCFFLFLFRPPGVLCFAVVSFRRLRHQNNIYPPSPRGIISKRNNSSLVIRVFFRRIEKKY